VQAAQSSGVNIIKPFLNHQRWCRKKARVFVPDIFLRLTKRVFSSETAAYPKEHHSIEVPLKRQPFLSSSQNGLAYYDCFNGTEYFQLSFTVEGATKKISKFLTHVS
jgi:hypothetical protein